MGLALVALGSAWLSLWGIADGVRSEYYAAVARSMSMSWHNLLYGAMDPTGVVSIDKVPGSFWWMALSVRLFGMHTWAVLLPSGIATVITTATVAITTRRWLGDAAGLTAGAVFALTPIVAAVARSNQPHVVFVCLLAIAVDRAVVAVQQGSRRTLIIAGLWIAAAFQSYMLAAWAIWPAVIVAWLVAAPLPRRRRVLDLLAAGVLSGLASLWWIALVTLTPAGARPWVGGTDHNSAIEMVFGYNGFGRFGHGATTVPGAAFRGFVPPFGGPVGWGRLFNAQMGGQVAWLLPAAMIGAVLVLLGLRRMPRHAQGPAILTLGWFATFVAIDSLSAGVHQFYAAALAPAMGALVAAGIDLARRRPRRTGTPLLIGLLAVTAATALLLAARMPGYLPWVPWVQLALAALVAGLLLGRAGRRALPALLVVALLLTPAAWAADAMHHPNAMNPVAGPNDGGSPTRKHGSTGDVIVTGAEARQLVRWLRPRTVGARFRLATLDGITASPFITTTGAAVLPIGGFDGTDPVPTLARVQAWVASGDLRYVLAGPGAVGTQIGPRDRVIRTWLRTHCAPVQDAPVAGLLHCGRG